jgi:hypothetical protein
MVSTMKLEADRLEYNSETDSLADGAESEEDEDEREGADEDEDDSCPICLDEVPNVRLATCGHKVCFACTKDMTKRAGPTPVLCPFCRAIISRYTAVKPSRPRKQAAAEPLPVASKA